MLKSKKNFVRELSLFWKKITDKKHTRRVFKFSNHSLQNTRQQKFIRIHPFFRKKYTKLIFENTLNGNVGTYQVTNTSNITYIYVAQEKNDKKNYK